jgi:hypothetical protein
MEQLCMVFAAAIHGCDPHFLTQNAKLKKTLSCSHRSQRGDPMDKYDVIGLVIAILAVSVVLLH